MKDIKQKLDKMSTEALKNLFYDFRNNEDDGSILVFDCIVDILEQRIGDAIWDM